MSDRLEAARRVAAAVLYEGYLLYPYRASSVKNQVRWQFGVVGPAGAADAGVGEPAEIATECLFHASGSAARLAVTLRFLHVQSREVQRFVPTFGGGVYEPVDELIVGASRWIPWHEAVEQELTTLELSPRSHAVIDVVPVELPATEEAEPLFGPDGALVGRLIRRREALKGRLLVTATPTGRPGLSVVRVTLKNVGAWDGTCDAATSPRDLAARTSFVGTHFLLAAAGGQFVSVVDPPPWAAAAAHECTGMRCWPVLVGEPGAQIADLVLAAPIILPEHPEVAQESPGDLFDATEIDEILTLRIMTLTDEEKLAARGTDPRAAAIIDRSDTLPPEVFERLHGAVRSAPVPDDPMSDNPVPDDLFTEAGDRRVSPETDSVMVDGRSVRKGSRVLLAPRRRADAHDMFLSGETAIVSRIDVDLDGVTHVAVLLENDPGRELHDWHRRYYYFGVEEIRPLDPAVPEPSQ